MNAVRQTLLVLGVLAMIAGANLPSFGVGRTIAEQSADSDTLLVPWGPSFSIWVPIFAGLLAFAIIQARPANRSRFVRAGWALVVASWATAAWGAAASLLDGDLSRWTTALLFVPIVAGAVAAVRALGRARSGLSAVERWLGWAPVSLYAGWVSLAAFLNWAQVGTYTSLGLGLPEPWIALLCLALALAFIVWTLHTTRGNAPYAFSALWGLAFLAYARLAVDDLNAVVGAAAIAGCGVVLGSAVAARRRV